MTDTFSYPYSENEELIITRADEFCETILVFADVEPLSMITLKAIEVMIELQAAPRNMLELLRSSFHGWACGKGYETHYLEHETEYLAACLSTMEINLKGIDDNEGYTQ